MLLTRDTSAISFGVTPAAGSAQAPLVLLHGALGSQQQFAHVQARFPEQQIITMDFPSHGNSTTSLESISTTWLAAEMIALLDHLGLGAVDIIGYSLGGYVAMEMAILQPDRIRSIVSHAMKFYWTEDSIEASMRDLDIDAIKTRSEKAYNMLSRMHDANGVERTMSLSRGLISRFIGYQLDIEAFGLTAVPILLSVGDRDELVPLPEILRLYQQLGYEQASLAIYPNTRHAFHLLPVEPFENAVRQFWSKIQDQHETREGFIRDARSAR